MSIYARDIDKADGLAAEFGRGGDYGGSGDLAELQHPIFIPNPAYVGQKSACFDHVIVNATTLGMVGQPPLTIDLAAYPDDTIVYDLVYAPLDTPLLVSARTRGLRTIDGLAMLIGQAAAAFELFFGARAPREHDAELRALLTT